MGKVRKKNYISFNKQILQKNPNLYSKKKCKMY